MRRCAARSTNKLPPWPKAYGGIPTVGSAFVWRMEAVLDRYAAPADPARPVSGCDEYPYARPPTPGQVRREDDEEERRGRANRFAVFAPATGWRPVTVTTPRTKRDFAEQMRVLAEEPSSPTPRPSGWCATTSIPPPPPSPTPFSRRGRGAWLRSANSIPPKHGRWLNMVEIEWRLLARQCLAWRIGAAATRQQAVAAWVTDRTAAHATANGCVTTPEVSDDPAESPWSTTAPPRRISPSPFSPCRSCAAEELRRRRPQPDGATALLRSANGSAKRFRQRVASGVAWLCAGCFVYHLPRDSALSG